jgi:hypothetical protein
LRRPFHETLRLRLLTGLFFFVSIVGHWVFGWFAFVDEQQSLHQAPHLTPYLVEMGRDTFENWQSEFLQLIWQVVAWPISSMSARRRRRRTTIALKPSWMR